MIIPIIGYVAQVLFGARMVVQWILSERARESVSPAIFWRLSLVAGLMMMVYGYLRGDVSILLGQLLTYFIYIRNLHFQGDWAKLWIGLRVMIIGIPIAAVVYVLQAGVDLQGMFVDHLPIWLITLGVVGQLVFTSRFVVQWIVAERESKSVLPPIFWWTSLTGALLILAYGVIRVDGPLIMGTASGLITYVRNIILGRQSSKTTSTT